MLGFKQNDVRSANFVYQVEHRFLAFAYLGGITSINGAIVAGLLGTGGLNAVVSTTTSRAPTSSSYIAVLGGVA